MKSIKLKNLRSFADTNQISIKPLTILLGRNSAGKSTFLRSFPLLRQSSEQKTINDVLWFGDYVDFGSFADSLHRSSNSREIEFEFLLDIPQALIANSARWTYQYEEPEWLQETIEFKFSLKQLQYEHNDITRTMSEYYIEAQNSHVRFVIDEDLSVRSIAVNSIDILDQIEDIAIVRRSSLLPQINIEWKADNCFDEQLYDYFRDELVHGRVGDDAIKDSISRLKFGTNTYILKQLQGFSLGGHWTNKVNSWTEGRTEIKKIGKILFSMAIEDLLELINSTLSRTLARTRYITPLRASAERFYRLQGLSVDEIAPDGKNLAMFLKSLPEFEAASFAQWTAENMGFSVMIEDHKGHVSIVIEDPVERTRTNLADVGFGYSQVIPILAQLWQLGNNPGYPSRLARLRNKFTPLIFLIEQPELHLHPSMQGRLATLFINAILVFRKEGVDLRIILETHSETIVSKAGHLIREKSKDGIRPQDIGVYLFEKGDEALATTCIKESEYDSEGFLENWPYDFFDGTR